MQYNLRLNSATGIKKSTD